jgi:hypothetical protein
MGIALPWAVLMAVQAYKHGIAAQPPQMPEPYWFFYGSAAMGVAGLVAMANQRLGVVMAWAFLIGAMVYSYQTDKTTAKTKAANANPTASGLTNNSYVPQTAQKRAFA